jgi:hypothetical protein
VNGAIASVTGGTLRTVSSIAVDEQPSASQTVHVAVKTLSSA